MAEAEATFKGQLVIVRMEMKMGTIWRIRADMRRQGYNLPDWV